MNGSVAAEQTPHLSHRDVHSFEIESFNPQLRKEEGREGGFRVEWAEDGKRKGCGRKKRDRQGRMATAGGEAQSSKSERVYVYFNT